MTHVEALSRTFTVSNTAELRAVLSQANAGDKILLAGGEYGDLGLNGRRDPFLKFDGPVTIAAADPGNPPVFSGLDVRDTKGLTFQGLHFDYSYQDGQNIWHKPFKAWNNDDISFIGNTFTGDVARGLSEADNGFPTGFGLQIRGGQNVTVSENDISGFFRGLTVSRIDNVTVTHNELHGIRMDGMNFSAVQGVLIEGNQLHNFARSMDSSDHADMIQFWTNGTTRPSTDIVIRDNILDLGAGYRTQSIFMRNDLVDRGLAGEEMFYRNVLIEGNVITNAHLHGITLGETIGAVIRNNTVLAADGATEGGATSGVRTPRISVAETSQDVTIVQNITSSINGFSGQADWHVDKNVLVQKIDPMAPGYYGDVFVTSSLGIEDGRHNFIARPDSEIVLLGAGAAATRAPLKDAAFTVSARDPGIAQQMFDASLILDQLPAGSVLMWDFGDGTAATGFSVTHTFAVAGNHTVSLHVQYPDGTVSTAQAQVNVQAAELLSMGKDGSFSGWQDGGMAQVASFAATEQGSLQLGGPGITASIAREVITPMLQQRDVTISFTLDADVAGASGEVFRLHNSLLVSVDRTGALDVRASSSEGDSVRLIGAGTPLNSGNPHAAEIRLSDGTLSLWVDGALVAQTEFNGRFADNGRHDLNFGNSWHDASRFFDGQISDFAIRLDAGAAGAVSIDALEFPPQTDVMPAFDGPETQVVDDAALQGDAGRSTLVARDVVEMDMQPAEASAPSPQLGEAGVTARLSRDIQTDVMPAFEGPETQVVDDAALQGDAGRSTLVARDVVEMGMQPAAASTPSLQLGEAGITASLSRDTVQTLFNDRDLDISFSLATNGADMSGEVFRLHQAIVVEVDKRGAVMVRAWSSEGDAVRLISSGVNVADGARHDVDIRLSDGKLSLWVNGNQFAETAFNGTFRDQGRHDLTFGNNWHGSERFVDAELDRFEIAFDADHQIDAFSAWASLSDIPLM